LCTFFFNRLFLRRIERHKDQIRKNRLRA
jgi:hypothetical protein